MFAARGRLGGSLPFPWNKVPGEGIVLRKEVLDIDVYKHKSFRFKAQESEMLDTGEVDLETQESEKPVEETA